MNTRPIPRFFLLVLITALSTLLMGCKSILPHRSLPAEVQSPLFVAPPFQPTPLPSMTPDGSSGSAPSQPENCINGLSFIFPDLTFPDGTQVAPNASLDKQWQVKNSGTCNWEETYTLQLTAGVEMGAVSPQGLVPARSGAEVVIRIQFTAPTEPGRYRSAWQAYDPAGQPFGDPIYIEIVVVSS